MKCRGILDSLLWCWWANKDDLYRRSLHGASSESTWMKQTEHDDKWKWWVFVCVSWERENGTDTESSKTTAKLIHLCTQAKQCLRVCSIVRTLHAEYTHARSSIHSIYPEYRDAYIKSATHIVRATWSTHSRATIQVKMTIIQNRHANSFVSIALNMFKFSLNQWAQYTLHTKH